jgi:hypothetical protein
MQDFMHTLYQTYCQKRAIELTETQFSPLIFAFPPLMVVSCDGIVDDLERKSMEFIAKSLAFSFNTDGLSYSQILQLAETYISEFNYLLDHIALHEADFLKALEEYLSEHEEGKEDVKDMLITAAEASDGISEIEQITIDKISSYLKLDS